MEIDFSYKYAYIANGCSECNNTGYYERVGIFEILLLTDEIKELIISGASSIEIKNVAIEKGYRPIAVDGVNKVLQGLTTLEEVNKKLNIY